MTEKWKSNSSGTGVSLRTGYPSGTGVSRKNRIGLPSRTGVPRKIG